MSEKKELSLKDVDYKIEKLISDLKKAKNERLSFIIKNKEYVFDLKDYDGKRLESIRAIKSDGSEMFLPLGGIVEVRKGKLFCSSYDNGIVLWSENDNCYTHSYYCQVTKLDILGFIDIEVE